MQNGVLNKQNQPTKFSKHLMGQREGFFLLCTASYCLHAVLLQYRSPCFKKNPCISLYNLVTYNIREMNSRRVLNRSNMIRDVTTATEDFFFSLKKYLDIFGINSRKKLLISSSDYAWLCCNNTGNPTFMAE